MTAMPGMGRLYLDYCRALTGEQQDAGLPGGWYALGEPPPLGWLGAGGQAGDWAGGQAGRRESGTAELVALLAEQNTLPEQQAALGRIGAGARVVVTGQQVGLFGGPAFTAYKAASAVAMAGAATAAGAAHEAIFWLATEDHDFAEINHVVFPGPGSPGRRTLERLTYGEAPAEAVPVGQVVLGHSIEPLVEAAQELLGYSDAAEWLGAAYRPGNTLAGAFAEFYGRVFASHGLLTLDPAGRAAHRLGAPVFRAAIERADELHAALVERGRELVAAGYHAQVAVGERSSVLFLMERETGARVALRRTQATTGEPQGLWQAGRRMYTTSELLGIVAEEPERISPSALLRPVFQDFILPNSAYVGGPAEIAYFAQSAVLYERILGRQTPVLPRLSATLVEPAVGELLARHGQSAEAVFGAKEDELKQRLGARAMPVEGKLLLAGAGSALDRELTALTEYMAAMDESLGRSAHVSASKMRYQMNRLRRMAAKYQLQRESSIGRDAGALCQALSPGGSLQERTIGAAYFLAGHGEGLVDCLVAEAGDGRPGHKVVWV